MLQVQQWMVLQHILTITADSVYYSQLLRLPIMVG